VFSHFRLAGEFFLDFTRGQNQRGAIQQFLYSRILRDSKSTANLPKRVCLFDGIGLLEQVALEELLHGFGDRLLFGFGSLGTSGVEQAPGRAHNPANQA